MNSDTHQPRTGSDAHVERSAFIQQRQVGDGQGQFRLCALLICPRHANGSTHNPES